MANYAVTWRPKDPQEKLFYELDWGTKRLEATESLVTSSWAVAEGDVDIAASPAPSIETGDVTRVWLEGGTDGETCIVTNTVTTNLGQTREASARIKIKTK